VVTRGPAYPFFIALVYKWAIGVDNLRGASARDAFDTIRRTQAVLDALNCLAVFAMTRLLWPSSFVPALLAALLAALWMCPAC
jgi:hypothetical protein